MSSKRSKKPSGPEFVPTPGMVYDPSPRARPGYTTVKSMVDLGPDHRYSEPRVVTSFVELEPDPRDLEPRVVTIWVSEPDL